MAKNERRATDQLNVALAGADAAITAAKSVEGEQLKKALDMAAAYLDEARQHLITIQFHSAHI